MDAETISKISVKTPLIYMAVVVIALVVFGSKYRSSQINKLAQLDSVFNTNHATELYLTLQEEDVHEKVLKAALINRGAECVRRSLKLKEIEPLVKNLYQRGSIGEEFYLRFQNETKLVELDFQETMKECERLKQGWAPIFVNIVKEVCFNEALHRRYESIAERKDLYKEMWELDLDDNGRLIK